MYPPKTPFWIFGNGGGVKPKNKGMGLKTAKVTLAICMMETNYYWQEPLGIFYFNQFKLFLLSDY